MRNNTRQLFSLLLTRIAELNHVPVEYVEKGFSVDPTIAQTLYEVAQQSSAFMAAINLVPMVASASPT